MPAQRNDPLHRHNFLVEIDGIAAMHFLSAEGLEAQIDVVEFREGGEENYVRKLPGMRKVSNITLRRGLTRDLSLQQWFQQVLNGQLDRRNGTITVLDHKRQPQIRFAFYEAWPCRLAYSGLSAADDEVALEEITLVVERLEMETI